MAEKMRRSGAISLRSAAMGCWKGMWIMNLNPENDPFYGMRGKTASDKNTARMPFLSKIFVILAVVSFVSLFLMPVILTRVSDETGFAWIMPCLFGCIFLFVGLAVACTKPGRWIGLLFAAVGLCVAGISAVYGISNDATRELMMSQVVPTVFLSVFVLIGVGFLILPGILTRRKAAVYTREVQATVCAKNLRVSRDFDRDRSRTWVLSWKYYAGGRERVYQSNIGRSPERREVGDTGVLYVNPMDSDDVWEKPGPFEKILFLILGVMFAGIGCFAMIMLFLA